MKKIAALAIIITVNAHAQCTNHTEKDVQNIIDQARVKYHIPGLEVSISCRAESIPRDFVSGTSLTSGGPVIEPDYFFQVGSETKSFVSVVMLQLEAEGVLSINDTLGKWLPQINSAWQNITIRQLLNHTSGIYNYTDVISEMVHAGQLTDFTKQWTSEELINLVANKPFYFTPGQGWHYSNTNYVLAGMIIEAATHQSVEEHINTRIIYKLNLSNTRYWPKAYTPDILQRLAHGYSERGVLPNEPADVTFVNNSWSNAAGGLISNTHDMAAWVRKLSANELLPTQQMQELTSLVGVDDGQPLTTHTQKDSYGLGIRHDFATFGQEAWWHTGSTLGYNSVMVWLRKSDIAITVNTNHAPVERDAILVAKELVRRLAN